MVVDAQRRARVALRVEVDDQDLEPDWASAAATLTVVVVLPTPPFWLATVRTRVWSGFGKALPGQRDPPAGVHGHLPGQRRVVVGGGQRIGKRGPLTFHLCQGRPGDRSPRCSALFHVERPVHAGRCWRGVVRHSIEPSAATAASWGEFHVERPCRMSCVMLGGTPATGGGVRRASAGRLHGRLGQRCLGRPPSSEVAWAASKALSAAVGFTGNLGHGGLSD